ncbi:thioredoxin [Priestia filamentosa]|uniref:thioredoxin n=1 Tax=Priestia filamentosa TaxID=1402861 RepID=UPI000588ED08
MAIVNATDKTFKEETASGLVLVDFWAPWCGPCKMIAPVLEELNERKDGALKIVKVDVDENQDTAKSFNIMSIPTLLVLKDGNPVETIVGFKTTDMLEEIMSKHK